jgi:uncharacterized damage-inducible protein DinB
MSHLRDLFEYNLWANQIVLAATDQVSPEALTEPMPELGGSTLEILDHLAQVQANFFGMMTGGGRPPREDNRPYAAVRAAIEASSNDYLGELETFEKRLEDTVELAWLARTFTIEQCLIQVATNSIQHRAGIAGGVARAGGTVQNLDYILWAAANR